MRSLLVVLATLAAVALLVLVFPYTGLYNVSATASHAPLVGWYLHTMAERSVGTRADEIDVPADLADSARVARGAVAFSEMCQVCHGAPGRDRSVIGQGITPQPPSLSEEAPEWQTEEIFWIVEHGIKMTGMPAFGPTHSDEELWEIVAFVEQLPGMTPQEYQALTAPPDSTAAGAAPSSHAGHDHVH